MKTTILTAAIAILGLTSGFGQEGNITIGVNGGLPVGDVSELTTFNLGADIAYRMGIGEQFQIGGLAAYSHFFGDSGEEGDLSWEVEDAQFLPLAASARFLANSFFAGADLGYALGINEDNEGGFYYRPHVGYNFGNLGVLASYAGISRDGFTVASVNIGIEFKL